MSSQNKPNQLLTTFTVAGDLFGIEVLKVQEVTGHPQVVAVPLAPSFVLGLVNLRGQIATALGLRELFHKETATGSKQMSVVCKIDGNLVSLLADTIGDVVEVENTNFEASPETVPLEVRRFIKGIYKMNGQLLSVLDLDVLAKELSPSIEPSTNRQ